MASTATDFASIPAVPAGAGAPAPASRRLAAGTLDAFLLSGGFFLVLGTELAIATEDTVEWVAIGWTVAFAPLYFALYHAYGTGATPGQLELRIGVRDARTGELPGLVRSVVRAYLGFGFLLLVVPALIDLATLANGRSLRDRLTRIEPVGIALSGKAPELTAPTVPELTSIFEPPTGGRNYLARGWALLTARTRLALGPVAAVSAILVGVAALVAVLLTDSVDEYAIGAFVVASLLLLPTGVYWSQAVVATATEEIRVGDANATVWGTVLRASRRVNALSAALVLLLLVGLVVAFSWLLLLPLAARLTLVAPALVLEDTRVLGAFARSWQLTRGQTWRLTGLLLASGAVLVGGTAAVFAWNALSPGIALTMAFTATAFVVFTAWLGAAWSLVYEDARRALPPGGAR